MAQAPPSGYYQAPRPVTPSYFPQYPQTNHQRIPSYSPSIPSNQAPFFPPHYAMPQGPPQAAPQGNNQKKYQMAQVNTYRPSLYMPPTPAEDYFATSKGSIGSASTPSISSLHSSNTSPSKRHQPRSRSFSSNSVQQLAGSTTPTSHPSLVVSPAPDRYHRRKSMVSLSSAAAVSASYSHAHSQSASSISPPSTASSASASTSSSSAISNSSPTTLATNTPLSSATSISNSPVLLDTKPLYKPQKKDIPPFDGKIIDNIPQLLSANLSGLGTMPHRKQHLKPFIASSTTPAPPTLVLPSDARRSSLVNGGKPRSASTSPVPPSVLSKPAPPLKPTPPSTTTTPTTSSNISVAKQKSPSPGLTEPLQQRKQEPVQNIYTKPSLGQKLRKAFSFGKKPQDPARVPARASTMGASITPPVIKSKKSSSRAYTLSTAEPSHRRSSPSLATTDFEGFSSVTVQPPKHRRSFRRSHTDDDTTSLNSISSVSSFSTLRKMGTSLSKGTKSLFSPGSRASTPVAFVHTSAVPKTNSSNSISSMVKTPVQTNSHSAGTVAPTITHAIAEAERPQPLVQSNSITQSLTMAAGISTNSDTDSIADAGSIINVSSENMFAKTPSDSESDEDLNAADTVFPKNLDTLTVENIRSSLERTKSLERRRSRRSTKSAKSTKSSESDKRKSSTLANALEVHITQDEASLSIPGSPTITPPGILKPSQESSFSVDPETPAVQDSALPSGDQSPTSPGSLFDFTPTTVNLDLSFDLPTATTASLEPEARMHKSSLKATPKDYSVHKSKNQAYYHPLYQPPRHSSRNSSRPSHRATSSMSSAKSGIPGSVSFSSRIIIYDTYDSTDYDRRAEIATCNRLNPLLAQQIKEELNNFKMEMDVHADSRIYTHFF